MSDDEIRKYLGRTASKPKAVPRMRVVPSRAQRAPKSQGQESFKNFSATQMMCPTCRRATPVRERLMLVLPDGDLFEYRCAICATSVGTRRAGH